MIKLKKLIMNKIYFKEKYRIAFFRFCEERNLKVIEPVKARLLAVTFLIFKDSFLKHFLL